MTSALSLTLQIIAALFMAFIWAAFLRKVDIFRPEKWMRIFIAFLFGCIGPFIVLGLHRILPQIHNSFYSSDPVFQVLSYFTINVGLLEEASKFICFLFLFFVFKKWFDEDINFIIYGSLAGIGFATVENCLYFNMHGVYLVYLRGLMCDFGHMAGTSIVAAMLGLGLRKKSFYTILLPLLGLMIVSVLHGLYDAFLQLGGGFFGFIASALVFLLEIELWAQYANNFLNRSHFYKNNIAIDRTTLQKFLIAAFILASLIQFAGLASEDGFASGLSQHLSMLIFEVVLTFILVARLTRYTVKPGHWEKIYPRLPVTRRNSQIFNSPSSRIPGGFVTGGGFMIRGDEFNEYPFTSRINKLTALVPFKNPKYNDNQVYHCWLLDKVFLGKKKELYYLCELAGQNFNVENAHPKYFLIKPKLEGTKYFQHWPIIGIITLSEYTDIKNISMQDARFLRWSVFKDEENEHFTQTWKEMIF
jgi:RsiW-degrading membrane proteinase PrsW (M82 family)